MIEIKLPLDELIEDLKRVDHHTVKEELWRIEEFKKLNPSGWEVDEEALCVLINGYIDKCKENRYSLNMGKMVNFIAINSTKWLKPVRNGT